MKGIKKALLAGIAGVGLMLASAIPALADGEGCSGGFEIGGWMSQGQYMINTVIPDYNFSQEQLAIQMTSFSVGETTIMNVGITEYGYMEQQIECGGGAYTATSNSGGFYVESLSAGTIAAASSNVAVENGYGNANSVTEVEVTFLGE